MTSAETANPADVLEVVNPFDLKAIGSVALKTWTELDDHLTTASLLHSNRKSWLPAYNRIDIFKKAVSLMEDRFDELAFQIANEGGKPLRDARVEVTRAIDSVGLCIHRYPILQARKFPWTSRRQGQTELYLPLAKQSVS